MGFFITDALSFSVVRDILAQQQPLPLRDDNSYTKRHPHRYFTPSSRWQRPLSATRQIDSGEGKVDNANNRNLQEELKNTSQDSKTHQPQSQSNDRIASSTKPPVWVTFLLSAVLLVGPVGLVVVPPAHAGFGPSSGATTSPPPGLTVPNVQNQDLITGTAANKKLKILIGSSLDERRLAEFNQQLDVIIDSLREQRDAAVNSDINPDIDTDADTKNALKEASTTSMDEDATMKAEELEKAKLLQSQILDRERLLDKLEAQPYWFNYFAAFIGSVASTLVMHPVDTIKTRQMLTAASDAAAKRDEDEQEEDANDNSLIRMLKDNINPKDDHAHDVNVNTDDDSFLSLYEGLTGNIWKEGPPSALYLGVYETVKASLLTQLSNPQYLLFVYLLAGAAGELVGSVVRAPAEAVKSLVQSKSADSALEAARRVLGTPEGRQNVVRAWSASIGRDVPFGAIQLATFELVKAAILNNPNIDFDSSTLASEAIIGAFAGACGAFITTPTDVITTRIITQSAGASDNKVEGSIDNAAQPLGVIDMGKKIYREEGIEAFFTGWTARVGYWAPAISIFLTCYCSVRQAGVQNDIFG